MPETNTPEAPMPEIDPTAVTVLSRQVEALQKQLSESNRDRDEYRDALKTLADERDEIRSSVEGLTKERDEAAAAAAASPEKVANKIKLQARIDELEGAMRDRIHYDRFSELAKEAGAKPAALKHLWDVSKYKAADDKVDDEALGKVLDSLQESADYAFDIRPEPAPEKRETVKTRGGLEFRSVPNPAGGGRSKRNGGQDGTIITAEMRADPKFMLDPRNKETILTAAKEGRFR